ncbi:transposase, partial [Bdellovibrionota bacterium FG-2]
MLNAVGKIIKLVGSPILRATRYNVHKLRCNACDWIFSPPLPEEAKGPRESNTAKAMVAILKYGVGVPFYRLAQVQGYLKVPASASALWSMLKDPIVVGLVVWKEMRLYAAQGEVIHNDDTKNKIMVVIREQQRALRAEDVPKPKGKGPRKGIFTSGILAKNGSVKIMLFFTGHKNAGENLEELLAERDASLPEPIQMSDASTMNTPGNHKVHSGLCLTHDRRYFVKSHKSFKQASTHVIKQFREVYKIEAQAKRLGLSP